MKWKNSFPLDFNMCNNSGEGTAKIYNDIGYLMRFLCFLFSIRFASSTGREREKEI